MSSGPHFFQVEQVEELRRCVADLTNANQQLQRTVDDLEQATRRLKHRIDAVSRGGSISGTATRYEGVFQPSKAGTV